MKNKGKNRKRIKTVWIFAKPYTFLFIVAEICILVTYAVALLLPLNLSRLTDQVLNGTDQGQLPVIIRDYLLLFLVSTVFNIIYAFTWQTLNNRYVVDVKVNVFEKVMHAKASFLADMNSGDIMSRIDGDADQFINIIQRNLFHFVNSILLCIGIIYMVASINLIAAFMLVIAAAAPIMLTRISGKFTEKYTKQLRDTTGEFTGNLFETLKGMREIRLLCAQWWAIKRLFLKLKKIIGLNNSISKMNFIVDKGTYLIDLSISLVIYGYCATLIYSGDLTVGMFLAIIQYIALLHKKFNWLLRIYLDWHGRKINIDRVNTILDTESEQCDGNALDKEVKSIEFRDVSFGYGDKTVIDHVSFKINKGEKVAIVGASGVGKTTITGLILKFFEPQAGEIRINDENISALKYEDIRKDIGIVQQDILLFNDTIRYNLLLGNQACPDDKLMKCCEKVGLKELIESLPDGLDTKIGANAHELSGGQKQRLMLARVLLKGAKVIIFDEATSALDVETEAKAVKAFQSLGSDITMIIISHRLAAIQNCDRIIVMNGGRIDSIGRHDDLIGKSGVYQSLFAKGAA